MKQDVKRDEKPDDGCFLLLRRQAGERPMVIACLVGLAE
jgi:hypothetical protein